MAFQIIDDVLDLIGDPALLESRWERISEVECSPCRSYWNWHTAAVGTSAIVTSQAASRPRAGVALVLESGRVDEAIGAAREYAASASTAIAGIPNQPRLVHPSSYIDWALERFVS